MAFLSRLLVAFAVLAAIGAAWWWFGRPQAMPPSPLAEGERVACVSYAPFEGDQSPFDPDIVIPPEQIDRQLAALARVTDCVRTYSTQEGLDQVPPLARKHGLKVLLGIWVGREADNNAVEIAEGIRLANAYPDVIEAVVVGNEVLLRSEQSPAGLMALIRQVKEAVPVPVTYADVWEFWLRFPEVLEAVDFATVHLLPYWEDHPIAVESAIVHIAAIRRLMDERLPGKEILIGEVGWPSAGRMREGALPSPVNQARFFHELLHLLRAEGWRYNLIEAFDQPWKRVSEGTVGGHWGFLDEEAQVKFAWGEPVSNHPDWPWQALGGGLLALLVLWAGRRAAGPALGKVALLALAAGLAVPWWCVEANDVSLTVFDWGRSSLALVLSIVLPLLIAYALARGTQRPTLAMALGGAEPPGPLSAILAWGLTLTVFLVAPWVIALVFDPRYRDFLSAAMAVPVLSLALLPARGRSQAAGPAELVFAPLLLAGAAYVAIREGGLAWITFAWAEFNHQALVWSLLVVLLALALRPGEAWRARAGRG